MTFDELADIVIMSANEQSWLRNGELRIWTLKSDLMITLRERDHGDAPEHLEEPWAVNLGHDLPVVYVFELWYGASFVKDFHFASVDGGRALLPYPLNRDNLTITRLQFAIAIAVNSNARFNEYLHRAGFEVEQQSSSRNN
jgi:hypothetical protein